MPDFKLSDLQATVEKSYGPWEVEWGEGGETRTIKFNHLLTATSEARSDFYRLAGFVAATQEGSLTDEQVREYLDLPEDEGEDVMPATTAKIREVMRGLSTDKRAFDAFAKAMGKEFVIWTTFMDAYVAHFEVEPGESKPSQTS